MGHIWERRGGRLIELAESRVGRHHDTSLGLGEEESGRGRQGISPWETCFVLGEACLVVQGKIGNPSKQHTSLAAANEEISASRSLLFNFSPKASATGMPSSFRRKDKSSQTVLWAVPQPLRH
eukprot:scaffold16269_cov32-Tisochrysis_lutea.AAC.1